MKTDRNIFFLLGIVLFLVCPLPMRAEGDGSSCDKAMRIGTGLTNLDFPRAGTYWFEAWTYDLPIDVIFLPENQSSNLEPEAWADFRCGDDPYDEDVKNAFGIGSSTYIQLPIKLALKEIVRYGKKGYQFTMDEKYREMISETGVTRNIRVLIRVVVHEAGSTDVDPDVLQRECLEYTRYLEETDTVHVSANDSTSAFVFPLSQWAKDSVRLLWRGISKPVQVYLGREDCHFTPDIKDPHYLAHFEIPAEGEKKLTDKDIKLLIKQLGSGGVYFGKIVSDEAADLEISLVPEITAPGIRLKYNEPVTVKAQDTTAFFFNKEWKATHFEVSTVKDVKVYFGLKYTIDPADTSTYFFACNMDYDNVRRIHYMDLSDKEMEDYCGRQTDVNEKYMYMKVVTSHQSQLSATEWNTSDHVNMSYQLRENVPIHFAGATLTAKDKIYRMRYSDWGNASVTLKRNTTGSVAFNFGITAITDWANLAFPSSTNCLPNTYGTMSKTKKEYTYDASVLKGLGEPTDPDGFYYWVFNSNKKTYDVTFTRTASLDVNVVVEEEGTGSVMDTTAHVSGKVVSGAEGTIVELEAVADNPCYMFEHWEDALGNIISTKEKFNYSILENTIVYAVFAPYNYTILTSAVNGKVLITVVDSQPEDSAATQIIVNCGKTVRLTAVPDAGYVFAKWADDATENPRLLEVTETKQLEALFEVSHPTNIQSIFTDQSAKKLIYKNALYIICNGEVYDAFGRKVTGMVVY